MFIKKHKKAVIGLVAVAVLSIGSATAFAAAPGFTLTPESGPFDTANVQQGTWKVVEGTVPQIAGEHTDTTAPGPTLTLVGPLNITDVQEGDMKEGTVTVVEGAVPQFIRGQSYTTAPGK